MSRDKKQDELERKDRQGAGRPGGSAAPGADERDDREQADTGAPQQTPPTAPPGATTQGPK